MSPYSTLRVLVHCPLYCSAAVLLSVYAGWQHHLATSQNCPFCSQVYWSRIWGWDPGVYFNKPSRHTQIWETHLLNLEVLLPLDFCACCSVWNTLPLLSGLCSNIDLSVRLCLISIWFSPCPPAFHLILHITSMAVEIVFWSLCYISRPWSMLSLPSLTFLPKTKIYHNLGVFSDKSVGVRSVLWLR